MSKPAVKTDPDILLKQKRVIEGIRKIGCCSQCDTPLENEPWRIVYKYDPLAVVTTRPADFQRVLRTPRAFLLLCSNCCFDLHLLAFAWVFSPKSPRNSVGPHPSFGGDKYRDWDRIFPVIYPPGDRLLQCIDKKFVRSLSYKRRGEGGKLNPSELHLNPYYGWAASNTKGLIFGGEQSYSGFSRES